MDFDVRTTGRERPPRLIPVSPPVDQPAAAEDGCRDQHPEFTDLALVVKDAVDRLWVHVYTGPAAAFWALACTRCGGQDGPPHSDSQVREFGPFTFEGTVRRHGFVKGA